MLVEIQGRTAVRSGEKLSCLVAFKESESNALRLQMLSDRLGGVPIDNLSRLAFRFGIATLEAALSAGLLEASE
jgi:hypothetical protein